MNFKALLLRPYVLQCYIIVPVCWNVLFIVKLASCVKSVSPLSSLSDIHNLLDANGSLLWMNASTFLQALTE